MKDRLGRCEVICNGTHTLDGMDCTAAFGTKVFPDGEQPAATGARWKRIPAEHEKRGRSPFFRSV